MSLVAGAQDRRFQAKRQPVRSDSVLDTDRAAVLLVRASLMCCTPNGSQILAGFHAVKVGPGAGPLIGEDICLFKKGCLVDRLNRLASLRMLIVAAAFRSVRGGGKSDTACDSGQNEGLKPLAHIIPGIHDEFS
jgi:hypothetical protein